MKHQRLSRILGSILLLLMTIWASGTHAESPDETVIYERLARYVTPSLTEHVAAAGNRVYLTSTRTVEGNPWSSLYILDVSQPQTPVLLGTYTSATPGRFSRICVVDMLVYLPYNRPGYSGGGSGVQIVDVHDPTMPTLVGSYDSVHAISDIQVVDPWAYLTISDPEHGGLDILNISTPSTPTLVGHFPMEQRISSLDVQDHLAYIASDRWIYPSSEALGGLHIVDVGDPTAPTLVGHYEMERADDVQVVGNHAYVGYVDGSISPGPAGQFLILDVSRPSTPTLLGSRWSATERMQVVGDVAYIAPGGWGVSSTVFLDVSDPTHITRVTERGISHPDDIAVVGEYVYVATGRLDILRLSTRNDEPVTDLRCFAETGHCISGRIRTYWEEQGGLAVFGLPLTSRQFERRDGRLVQVQWFERHRLELHADNEPPYDVLLGRLGAEVLEQQGRDWQEEFPHSEPQDGCQFMAATGHAICGAMLTAWQTHGLELGHPGVSEAERLALFGLPLSDAHTEHVSNGQSYHVQWFERARMEWHPTNEPPYQVLFGRLGAEVREE